MKDEYVFIGLDPGKSGFITIIDKNGIEFYPMPEEKIETGGVLKSGKPETVTQFSEKGLVDLVLEISKKHKGKRIAAIEDVGGRQGWSAQNNFEFGRVAGMQKMILLMLGCEIHEVRPQKWQSFMRQGYKEIKKSSSSGKTMVLDAKAIAEVIVKNEFPEIDFRKTNRAKKNDDNKIDSFLICKYIERKTNANK